MIVEAGAVPVVYDVLRSSDNEVVQQMAGRVIVNLAENGCYRLFYGCLLFAF